MQEALIYLSKISQLKKDIEDTKRKLIAYRNMAEGLSSKDFALGTRIDSSTNYKHEELILKTVAFEEKYKKLLSALNEEYFELELILIEMDDLKSAELLKLIHIDSLNFEEVAEKMGYTERHIRRLNEKALNSLSLVLTQKAGNKQLAK